MSEQPPEDLGAAQVLLVIAVVLAIIVIGVVVLVYDGSLAPQRALDRPPTSRCVQELASGVSSHSCPALLSQAPA